MADDKAKAPSTSPFTKDHYKEVLYVVLPGLLLLSLLLSRFFAYLNSLKSSAVTSVWDRIWYSLMHVWSIWKPLAIVISIGALVAAVYSRRRLHEVEAEEEKIFGRTPENEFLVQEETKNKENEKWVKIMAHAHSENPAEWRLAIIESDIMLEEMLKDLGYQGEGVGEMLKNVDPSDMLTLDQAWEAHKVRNRIAHSGQDFELSERETKRVVKLFEEVFQEFGVV